MGKMCLVCAWDTCTNLPWITFSVGTLIIRKLSALSYLLQINKSNGLFSISIFLNRYMYYEIYRKKESGIWRVVSNVFLREALVSKALRSQRGYNAKKQAELSG